MKLFAHLTATVRPRHARFIGHVIAGGLHTPRSHQPGKVKSTITMKHGVAAPVKVRPPKRRERYRGTLS